MLFFVILLTKCSLCVAIWNGVSVKPSEAPWMVFIRNYDDLIPGEIEGKI